MANDPLHTKLCDMLEIEYPIIAFTHCKDVATSVINAGGFAVLGEAMHTPEDIRADIKWIRDRVGDKQFGIDLVLPASATAEFDLEAMLAKIPDEHRKFAQQIKEKYDVPDPKGSQDLHQWGGLSQKIARTQLDVLLEERVPVIASGLGSPAFLREETRAKGIKLFGLVGKTRQAMGTGHDIVSRDQESSRSPVITSVYPYDALHKSISLNLVHLFSPFDTTPL